MTQINNIYNNKTVTVRQNAHDNGLAYINISTRVGEVDASVLAGDLAEALEEALGWTVITEPLPEVTSDIIWPRQYTVKVEGTARGHRARALAELALAKALEQRQQEHSVDEAEVERFEYLIGDIEKEHGHSTPELARYLVQAGARAPKDKEDE